MYFSFLGLFLYLYGFYGKPNKLQLQLQQETHLTLHERNDDGQMQ